MNNENIYTTFGICIEAINKAYESEILPFAYYIDIGYKENNELICNIGFSYLYDLSCQHQDILDLNNFKDHKPMKSKEYLLKEFIETWFKIKNKEMV